MPDFDISLITPDVIEKTKDKLFKKKKLLALAPVSPFPKQIGQKIVERLSTPYPESEKMAALRQQGLIPPAQRPPLETLQGGMAAVTETIAKPFTEYAVKPFAAAVTAPFRGKAKELITEPEKAISEYEKWEAPPLVKGAVEFIPWAVLPTKLGGFIPTKLITGARQTAKGMVKAVERVGAEKAALREEIKPFGATVQMLTKEPRRRAAAEADIVSRESLAKLEKQGREQEIVKLWQSQQPARQKAYKEAIDYANKYAKGKLPPPEIITPEPVKPELKPPVTTKVIGLPRVEDIRVAYAGKAPPAISLRAYPELKAELVNGKLPSLELKPPAAKAKAAKPEAPVAGKVTAEITLEEQKQFLIDFWTEKGFGKNIKPETWDENYIRREYNIVKPKIPVVIKPVTPSELPFGEAPKGKGVPPPAGPGAATVTGSRPIDRAITIAQEKVRQNRGSVISDIMDKIPGVKQMGRFLAPSKKMTGEMENPLIAMNANKDSILDVRVHADSSRIPLIVRMKQAFTKDQLSGKSATVLSATDNRVLNGSAFDMITRPGKYNLTSAQRAIVDELNPRNELLRTYVNEGYDGAIGNYVMPEGGAYLPNVDRGKNAIEALGGDYRSIIRGRSKPRFYQTAADRMAADKNFQPELDVIKLLEGLDASKSSIAGANAYRQVIGGKTRLEVIQELHPSLYNKMMYLRGRVSTLRSSLSTIDKNLSDAVDDFLASPVEGIDLDDLRVALDVKLKTGPRAGLGAEEVQRQLDGIRAQIKALKPPWENANTNPYTFLQNGIYRYFKGEEANLIRESLAVTNNSLLNAIEGIRAGAFSNDFSPFTIQGLLGVQAAPIVSIKALAGAVKRSISTGDWLWATSPEAFARDVADNIDSWADFSARTGMKILGTDEEFAAGFIGKIPLVKNLNSRAYIIPRRLMKNIYDQDAKVLIESGVPEAQAYQAAADIATGIIPTADVTIKGLSQARAAWLRALPTSYSFIVKPAEVMTEAAKGFIKVATKKMITPKERLAMKHLLTMSATILAASATSQAVSAWLKDEDPAAAALSAINPDPNNGNFASLVFGNLRVPLGGPYRGIFRAMMPREVEGVPVPVPFAGIPMFAFNRLTPGLRAQVDLLKNKDYYGYEILKGDWPEKLLRLLAYEFEAMVPLTAGAAVEAVRTGQTSEEMIEQSVGQFAGVNVSETKSKVNQLKDKLAKKDYSLTWAELATTDKGKLKQEKIMQAYPELKSTLQKSSEDYSLRNPEEGKTWLDYRNEGESIENRYREMANQAAVTYRRKQDGALFREDINDAKLVRREAYAKREKDLKYQTIRDYYNQPLTSEFVAKTNFYDLARREYYKMVFAPDMYDSAGKYNFDLADQREKQFIKGYGQEAFDYVEEFKTLKAGWEPQALKELDAAKKALEPYWDIEERYWVAQPQLREKAERLRTEENKGLAYANKYLLSLPYSEQSAILIIREKAAAEKKMYRIRNPEIAKLLIKWGY